MASPIVDGCRRFMDGNTDLHYLRCALSAGVPSPIGMSDPRFGSYLTRCSQCERSFTQTNWRLHAHNPAQFTCASRYCNRKAVGHSSTGGSPQLLCGEHLIEARRSGSEITFVDGRVCRMCEGEGGVHGQWVGPDPGGRWVSCPECEGTGYDPALQSQVALARSSPDPRPTKRYEWL